MTNHNLQDKARTLLARPDMAAALNKLNINKEKEEEERDVETGIDQSEHSITRYMTVLTNQKRPATATVIRVLGRRAERWR